MDNFDCAAELLRSERPSLPVLAMRPHLAERAAHWFLNSFPGEVIYALKANNAPLIVDALCRAGVKHFDVASLAEVETASRLPGAVLHLMNPVKSRELISRAYHEFGVRTFALDSQAELEKILEETGHARDLTLFVRIACAGGHSDVPLERKFGASVQEANDLLKLARQHADRLGITFHVGSQTMHPQAFSEALERVGRLIVEAGVIVDAIDVGGGFPSCYPGRTPPALATYMDAIARGLERLAVHRDCQIYCEPGRALVAEAESLIVRVEARRTTSAGEELFINDGSYGVLFDACHFGFVYPARLVGRSIDDAEPLLPFSLWGPTCDSLDHMPGPFLLPASIREGDYIEIGNIGAYGRVMAGRFNGYGLYGSVIVRDEPMLSLYPLATMREGSQQLQQSA